MAGRSAMIVGGSMSGLLAAQVLSARGFRVAVLERGHFQRGGTPRPGVPQNLHTHILLARGLQLLEARIPGFKAAMAARGALIADTSRDLLNRLGPRFFTRNVSGIPLVSCTRALVEDLVRAHVETLPGVDFRSEVEVRGLVGDQNRVRGVRLAPRGIDATEVRTADLVVDASGRFSKLPRWLQALGIAPPKETVIDAGIAYATRQYKRASAAKRDFDVAYVRPIAPVEKRGAVLMAVEGERWVLTLMTKAGDEIPTREAEFSAFLSGLNAPFMTSIVGNAAPLSSISVHRRTENRFTHYEDVRMPDGLVVVGDAACALNPVYGQGMTAAALHAELLHAALRASRRGWTQRFQRSLARRMQGIWAMATSDDLRYKETLGPRPGPPERLLARYMDRLLERTCTDPVLMHTFLEVTHVLRPTTALMCPEIIWRTLRPRNGTAPVSEGAGSGR